MKSVTDTDLGRSGTGVRFMEKGDVLAITGTNGKTDNAPVFAGRHYGSIPRQFCFCGGKYRKPLHGMQWKR